MARCKGKTKKGEKCTRMVKQGDAYCFQHLPIPPSVSPLRTPPSMPRGSPGFRRASPGGSIRSVEHLSKNRIPSWFLQSSSRSNTRSSKEREAKRSPRGKEESSPSRSPPRGKEESKLPPKGEAYFAAKKFDIDIDDLYHLISGVGSMLLKYDSNMDFIQHFIETFKNKDIKPSALRKMGFVVSPRINENIICDEEAPEEVHTYYWNTEDGNIFVEFPLPLLESEDEDDIDPEEFIDEQTKLIEAGKFASNLDGEETSISYGPDTITLISTVICKGKELRIVYKIDRDADEPIYLSSIGYTKKAPITKCKIMFNPSQIVDIFGVLTEKPSTVKFAGKR